ncbi:aminoglycoside phosphotransferase family protein [Plantactinospora siamensis]|uniref:Aminoglycoside phosphotransferase family protein n=1 Tax=Plantactinospora siamensis TaxID=555372 RepID=A0ABV6NYB3_9ACTN
MLPTEPVPEGFARTVVGVWGAAGRRWLDELPRTVRAVAAGWDLRVGEPFGLTFNWVAAATAADGTPLVLKLGVPGSEHLVREATALRIFAGRGAVRLLAEDPDRGALLLERARPGTMVRSLVPDRDAEATGAVAEALRRLHVPPPPGCPLPPLTSYRRSFTGHLDRYGGGGPLPVGLVDRARGLFDELCASAPATVVLHGDLHHDNLLAAQREPWLAIDPHGLVGDPGFDAGPVLYNPGPDEQSGRLLPLLESRIERLADGLGQPPERIRAWGYVMAVLSELWTMEDGGRPGTRALDVAVRLAPALP